MTDVVEIGSGNNANIVIGDSSAAVVSVVNDTPPIAVTDVLIPGPPGPEGVGVEGPPGPSGQAGSYVLVKNMGASTTYTPIASDVGCLVTFNGNASITLPTDMGATIAYGKTIDFMSFGGVLTFVESGTTINRADTLVTRKASSGATTVKVNSNQWWLVGDLV